MAKKIKTDREIAREAFAKIQSAYDQAAQADPIGARNMVYGWRFADNDVRGGIIHDAAIADDAEFVQARFVRHIEHLEREIGYANAKVAAWRESFDKDPAYAFAWSDGAMREAANAKVLRHILELTLSKGPVVVTRIAMQETLRGACDPQHSTSAGSNEIASYETAAWAKYAERQLER